MLEKINRLKNWQAAIIITVLGILAYFDGLQNQFLGDDLPQIVNNLPVHSISHIKIFFEGGTFYNGQGIVPLIGIYYRPLMTTVFSLIYTVFGSQPNFFHLIQLLLCIGSSIILYLFFRFTFKPAMSLFLALIFLIHPIDSQVVFAIASMQDALFFFFGILALYFLFRFKSIRSLIAVAVCLFLSLLAKESAVLFIAMALLYLFWYNRKRLYAFIGVMALPTVLYVVLRVHAIGWFTNSNNAPIDRLSLAGRLFTAPSIFLMYISKFVFPLKLAAWYYYVYPNFSIRHFLLPLITDLLIIALVIYTAFKIRQRASKARFKAFLFFAIWSALGMLMILQIAPLDFTASEPWFYFPMVGILGMIGITITTFSRSIHFDRRILFALMVAIILLLGVRTAIRGRNWSSDYNLAEYNLTSNGGDFQTYNEIAQHDFTNKDYYDAKTYASESVAAFPYASNYNVLGIALTQLGDYPGAYTALENGLKYTQLCTIYDNLSILTNYYGDPKADQKLLKTAIRHCSNDSIPWLFLAVLEYTYHDPNGAKIAITESYKYYNSSVPLPVPTAYYNIMNNLPLNSSN